MTMKGIPGAGKTDFAGRWELGQERLVTGGRLDLQPIGSMLSSPVGVETMTPSD
jgi:hypothetical protein